MLSSRIKTIVALWALAEALAFAALAHVAGLGWTLLAQFAISALGLLLLKRTGSAALIRLRAAFSGRTANPQAGMMEEALGVLGALLLLLPGFLSDVLGLLLVVPPARARAAAWLSTRGAAVLRRRGGGPAVVDLEPGEWRRGEGRGAPELRS